ncbi:uncharacterized protein K444DRAFT_711295, partial [Hyaloscypha bicolor E]
WPLSLPSLYLFPPYLLYIIRNCCNPLLNLALGKVFPAFLPSYSQLLSITSRSPLGSLLFHPKPGFLNCIEIR